MARVEQTIELARPPARRELHPDLEGGADAPRRFEGERPEMAAFGPRDHGTMDSRRPGEVLLSPSSSDPERPDRAAEAKVVHGANTEAQRFAAAFAPADGASPRVSPRPMSLHRGFRPGRCRSPP